MMMIKSMLLKMYDCSTGLHGSIIRFWKVAHWILPIRPAGLVCLLTLLSIWKKVWAHYKILFVKNWK